MKIKILLIMLLLFIPTIMAYTEIEWSSDNITFQPAASTNYNNITLEELNNGIDCNTEYFFRLRHVYTNGNSNWTYTSATTDECGEGEPLAAFAIIFFVLVISVGVMLIPKLFPQISKSEIVNLIWRRAAIVIGIYLMMMNSAIAATIADTAGINVTNEMFRYMWLFGTFGWIAMGVMAFKTLLDTLKMWKLEKKRKHLIDVDDEEDM